MKTLSENNPYLQDKDKARSLNARSARTSCGVEGIVAGFHSKIDIKTSRSDAIYDKLKKQLNRN